MKYFSELTKWKSFSVTAEKLFISQPALSKAIKCLEKELEMSLFYRDKNENSLTKQGHIFYEYVTQSLLALDKGVAHLESIKKDTQKKVCVGAIYICATNCVPVSIMEFSRLFPGVQFQCMQESSERIVDRLSDLSIDIGLIDNYEIPVERRYIERIELFKYRVLLAVPKNHPFSRKSSVKVEDFLDEPFVGYTNECGNRLSIEQYLETHRYEYPRNIRVNHNGEDSILASVEKELGVGLVSDTKFNHKFDVNFLPISNCVIEFPIYLIWRTDVLSSSVVNAYKDYVLQAHHLGSFY